MGKGEGVVGGIQVRLRREAKEELAAAMLLSMP